MKSYLLELGIHLVSSFMVVLCGDLVELSTLQRKKSVDETDALKMCSYLLCERKNNLINSKQFPSKVLSK